MNWRKRIVAAVMLVAVTAAFLGVRPLAWAAKLQVGPLAHRGLLGLALVLAIGLLGGRFFCEALCPLGIVQSCVNWLFHRKHGVRRVCTRLPETKVQFAVRWAILAVVMAVPLLGFVTIGAWTGLLDPYSIFGRALSLCAPSVRESPLLVAWGLLGVIIVVLAAFGKGRIWCNWACPYGTIFALCGRVSLLRNRIGTSCAGCKACFAYRERGRNLGIDEELESKEDAQKSADGVTRREALKGVAVLAVAEKTSDGGFAPVSLPGAPTRERPVLPPGAGKMTDFERKCVGCQLCVVNCPERCLKPSTDFRDFGQPKFDFRHGHCLISCTRCSEVCPAGAILPVSKEERVNVHMGRAVWRVDLCLRKTQGEICTACQRKCPVNAIRLIPQREKGANGKPLEFPMVDAFACIGCGACEHVCPVRPEPAIRVEGYDEQLIVKPIAPGDVIAEMRAIVEDKDRNVSIAVAKDGVIIAQDDGRGVDPLLRLLDAGKLKGAVVVDRVIGRAAAAICLVGGVKSVYASGVMSVDAKAMLRQRGVEVGAKRQVARILNRTKDGTCPLERAIETLNDPNRMVKVLRSRLAELKGEAKKSDNP